MDNIVQMLENIQRIYGNFLFGITGAFFAILVEGTKYARDVHRAFTLKLDSLVERVAKLEKTVPSTSGGGNSHNGLTAPELMLLTNSAISGFSTTNVTMGFKNYTGADRNNVAFHSLSFTASGAVTTASPLATITFPSVLPSPRCPEITFCPGQATYAGAEKPISLVPKFNSTNNCTGYEVWSRIALASGDVRDFSVRVRDVG